MPEFERNLLSYKKREEELGNSFFICQDINKDKQLQLISEIKEDSVTKMVKEIVHKDKPKMKEEKPKRELFYKEENQSPIINELTFMSNFFSNLKDSQILLSGQEDKELLIDNSTEIKKISN